MALDDKLYQRDLQVALALSAKELPIVTIDAEGSQGESNFIFYIFTSIRFLLLCNHFFEWAFTEKRINFNTLDYK